MPNCMKRRYGLPAAGQRSVTLVVRFDTRSDRILPGLLWRRDTIGAAVAASQRITRALCQTNCRARLLTAAQMNDAVAASLEWARKRDSFLPGPLDESAARREGLCHSVFLQRQ